MDTDKKCVIIDDEEIILYLLSEYAKYLKYTPICYKNIPDFMHDLSKNGLKGGIDLLITDKDVGAENGAKLVKELREKGHNFPIILITGDGTFNPGMLKNYGAGFLKKPFRISDFKEKVRDAYKLIGKEYSLEI